jgi:hypothetical protein
MKLLDPAYAYPFLGPLAIIIPVLFVIGSHRRDIHRSGTYIHVFFEYAGIGPKWETRLSKYRDMKKGESLDRLPRLFWSIFLISVGGFIFSLYKIIGICSYSGWLAPIIIIIIGIIFMVLGHYQFAKASVEVRHEYYETWKKIRDSEIG